MALQLGTVYSREQIRQEVGGGDLQSYLPHTSGNVLCGCFDPALNRKAPFEIDLGSGRDVIRYAQRLLEQATPVPVFLKRDAFAWEYVGQFRAAEYVTDTKDLYPAKETRRANAVAVLYLEIDPNDTRTETTDEPTIPTHEAIEGGAALATHLKRERNRQLLEAKRRLHRVEHGQLKCEACNLSEDQLPPKIGEGCFEVHHLSPVGKRVFASVTKLDDLAILCANCHRIIHRTNPMFTVRELARIRTR